AQATTWSYTLSLHDALPIFDGNGTLDLYVADNRTEDIRDRGQIDIQMVNGKLTIPPWFKDRLLVVNGKVLEYGEPDILYLNDGRSEEHTSELQSRGHLVCRL